MVPFRALYFNSGSVNQLTSCSQGAAVHSLRKQIILMLSCEVPGEWWRGAELIKRQEKCRAEREPTHEVWSLVRSYLPTASLPERSQSAMFLRSSVRLERRSFRRPLPHLGGSILKIVSALSLVLQEMHCYCKLTRCGVFFHTMLEENANGLIRLSPRRLIMLNQTIENEGKVAEEELLRWAKVGELKAEIQLARICRVVKGTELRVK